MVGIPKVSILILNYNTYQDTLTLIKNINTLLDYPNFNIIVVDNASKNQSAEILKKNEAKYDFHLIVSSNNGGYAAGNNLGIRFSYGLGSEYVWILNNDILLTDKDILKKLVNSIQPHSRVGVISPKVLKPSGIEEIPFYERPSLWDLTFGCFFYRHRRHKYQVNENVKIYRPQGCCMLLRNEYMKQIQEMDERTFLYGEEVILAERLLWRGYESWLCTETSVIHHHSKTVNSVFKKKSIIKFSCDSFKLYIEEYRGVKNLFIKWLAIIIKAGTVYVSY